MTDKTSLRLRHEIGIDIIAWECDYPHSDCFWPDAPEQVLAELNAAGADDADVNKITWENSCRFFGWDPFKLTPKEQATVGALRAKASDVDVSSRARSGPGSTRRSSSPRPDVSAVPPAPSPAHRPDPDAGWSTPSRRGSTQGPPDSTA